MNYLETLKQNKRLIISLIILGVIICAIDFFQRIQVPMQTVSREAADSSYVMPELKKGYELPESLSTWMKVTSENTLVDEDSTEASPTLEGGQEVGEYRIRVLAVFIGLKRFALVDIQRKGQNANRKRIELGDSIGNYSVTEIKPDLITLTNESEPDKGVVTVKVFNKGQTTAPEGV